jgi:replication-associated recombination protein RarA
MPYTEKYQPQNLGQCLYPNQATEDLIKDFAANATDANLILYGPMGTGKSLMAQMIADELCTSRAAWPETLQGTRLQTPAKSDAAADRIERITRVMSYFTDRRLFIIEEFDLIKLESQMAFSYLMDKMEVQMILTTNDVHKIDKRILSRARVCNISGATQQDMLKLAQHVVASEGVTATQAELTKLTVSAAGNVRDLLLDLEVLVLSKRKQSAQTAASQVITPPNVTAAIAQTGAGTPPAPFMLPTVSLITPNTPMGQPTP